MESFHPCRGAFDLVLTNSNVGKIKKEDETLPLSLSIVALQQNEDSQLSPMITHSLMGKLQKKKKKKERTAEGSRKAKFMHILEMVDFFPNPPLSILTNRREGRQTDIYIYKILLTAYAATC